MHITCHLAAHEELTISMHEPICKLALTRHWPIVMHKHEKITKTESLISGKDIIGLVKSTSIISMASI